MTYPTDTIAAPATATGKAGVGIIRISGPQAKAIAKTITGLTFKPRHAHFCEFLDQNQQAIDHGLALYFPGPDSFTGEDVVELQGHGGAVLSQILMDRISALGVRWAQPGEFSQRAFLNDKIDLIQAEAIADLIESGSKAAARNAYKSLSGEFSQHVNNLVEALISLRINVESAIDFPEEEIDFLADSSILVDLENTQQQLALLLKKSQQGKALQDGIKLVIAGEPNAGKSSLLNALSETDSAIVTHIAGTTRDVLREKIIVDNLPVFLVDTAGIRQSDDPVESQGIKRAWTEIKLADHILLVIDGSQQDQSASKAMLAELANHQIKNSDITIVANKTDKAEFTSSSNQHAEQIEISAITGAGISELKRRIKQVAGLGQGEGEFSARQRHVSALQQALSILDTASMQMQQHCAGELLAEDLRLAQQKLNEITGEFSSDDLLGRIFSSFCIGK